MTVHTRLSEDELLTLASRKAHLTDFGDEAFRVPLRVLIDSFHRDDDPSGGERTAEFRDYLAGLLVRRLLIRRDRVRYPGIGKVPLPGPLFITGLARTGTTLLHNLLSRDPGARPLLLWELMDPSPPPDARVRRFDPRIRLAEARLEKIYARSPGIRKVHEMKARWPEECMHLKLLTFTAAGFYPVWRVESYLDWLAQQDMEPSYRYYREVLQLLCWKTPGEHLLLKCPSHLPYIRAILAVFPDANIIWTHRDPCEALPSAFSTGITSFLEPGADSRPMVKRTYDYSCEAVRRAAGDRENLNPRQFFDVGFAQLGRDPLGTVKRIYQHFNYTFHPQMEEGIAEWIRNNPRHKHGKHSYNLESYGFGEDRVREDFSQYYRAFAPYLEK